MFRTVLAIICFLAFSAQAEELTITRLTTGCKTVSITTTTTEIWVVANTPINIILESNGSGVVVAIYKCTQRDTDYCSRYWWDHDLDGIRNQNTLDGVGDTFSHRVEIPASLFTRAEVTTSPSADDTAEIQACIK